MNYGNQAINQINTFAGAQKGLSAGHLGSSPIEAPLLMQEFDRIASSVCNLENQLEWLIGKIQPICQCDPVPCGVNENSALPGAQPSEIRQLLINLRNRIDLMTRSISGVKYTIEV